MATLTKNGYRKHHALCGECGGQCCRRMPGACVPEDFDCEPTKVVKALATGRWCLDWWEGWHNIYFVRAAIQGYEGQLFHGTWGGLCTFLTELGCVLTLKDRPVQCRLLEPTANGCESHAPNKHQTALAWRRWRPMFQDMMDHYNGSTRDHCNTRAVPDKYTTLADSVWTYALERLGFAI